MVAYTNYQFDARVRREAETLVSNGFAVQCLTPRDGRRRPPVLVSGVEVIELDVPKYRGKNPLAYLGSYLLFSLHAFVRCAREALKSSLDVVHVHNMPNFLVFSALVPRITGKKVVLDIHDNMPEMFTAKFTRAPRLVSSLLTLEERASSLLADTIICVNHPQRDVLIRHGVSGRKMFVSMNVPDPRWFPRQKQGQVRDGSFDLVYHGTMARRLGVDLVLRATALLVDRIPGLRVHLWGNGDDLSEFQNLAGQLGIASRVEFKPEGVPLEQLHRLLTQMDLGVIGNRSNCATDIMLPVKLLEYVCLGIPVVAPKLKAIQYYFTPEALYYYEPGDCSAMAEAILELYGHPGLREGQSSRAQSFLDTYCWERQGADFLQLYHSLIER